MNFRPELLAKVLNGTKTQTRRIVKPGERLCFDGLNGRHYVRSANGHMKWYESGVYAAAPGRSKHGVAHFRLLHIRREDVRQISGNDVREEGFVFREDFIGVWCQMHDAAWYKQALQSLPMHAGIVAPAGLTLFADLLANRPRERYDAWALTFTLEASHDE